MPDVPDIHTPLPDLAHESLRQSVVTALDSIEQHVERLDRVFVLLKGAGLGLQGVLNVLVGAQTNLTDLNQAIQQQATQIADLETRVSALENPTPPPVTS